VLIVLDTNMFWGDVHAERPWLRAILDGAEHGDFEVVVPEAVVQELVKRYPKRVEEALEEIRVAVGRAEKALRPLGLEAPVMDEFDEEELAGEYESRLRGRLSGAGSRIEPHPGELQETINWAVWRRKPFKESGEGFPDASIWITALELASDVDRVLLATNNTEDFGNGDDPPGLAPELVADLRKRRLPTDRVQLISDMKILVEEIVKPMAESEARAQRLIDDPNLSQALMSEVIDALAYTEVSQSDLELGVELDNDPQVVGVDVEKLELLSAREASDAEHLFLEVRAMADLRLNMAVYKADYYIADEDSPVSISRDDLNDHYFDGEAEVLAWVTLMIHTDLAVEEVEIEVVDVKQASIEEAVAERLEKGAAKAMIEQLRAPVKLKTLTVSGYQPDLILESSVEEASVEELDPEEVALVSVDEKVQGEIACSLRVKARGDVTWLVTAPSGQDAARHAALGEGEPGDAGWLSDNAANEPLVLSVAATLTPTGDWRGLRVEETTLDDEELRRRVKRCQEEEFEAEVLPFEESEREAGRIPGDEAGEGTEETGTTEQ
jgi:hypothetical protein